MLNSKLQELPVSVSPKTPSRAGAGGRRALDLVKSLAPLIGNHNLNDICERACTLIAQLLEVEACSLLLANEDRTLLSMVAATHLARAEWPALVPIEGVCGQVFREGRALLIDSEEQFKAFFGRAGSPAFRGISCAISPIIVEGGTAGVIAIASPLRRLALSLPDAELLDAAAELTGAIVATARQAVELRTTHRNMEDILESLHIGILSIDGQERVIHANQRARQMLDLPLINGDAPGLAGLLPEDIYAICRRLMGQSGRAEETAQERLRTTLCGRAATLEVTAGPMTCCDGEGGRLIMLEDVGQDEEIQRLRESESMKHNFLSVISHELRTPLAVIRGAVPLIDPGRNGAVDSDVLGRVQHLLLKNCQRLGEVIDTILDVTEIESGTLQLNPKPSNLHEILNEVIGIRAESAANRGVGWDCRLDAEHHEFTGDPRRLRQIFSELIGNAIKFSSPGGTIHVQTRARPPWLEIQIGNGGARIAPEQRRIIFEKFSQCDQTMTRTVGGCGLGLFLVQNLLRLHGGEIELQETTGPETTFIARLPMD